MENIVREVPDIETSSESYARRFAGPAGAYFLAVQQQTIEAVLEPSAGRTILDVGGGHGQLTAMLLERGWKVTILASDAGCYDRLKTRFDHPELQLVTGNLLNLPFADNSFDFIISVRLISHIEAWPQLITEFCRVARSAVVIDYPSVVSLNALTPLLFRLKKGVEGNTRTYTSFQSRQLADEFKRCGFYLSQQRNQFFLPMFLHRAFKGHVLLQWLEKLCNRIGLTRWLGSPVILRADRQI
jgi:ubiquinone/menaquinone biosynthesis C-methylase UbiE